VKPETARFTLRFQWHGAAPAEVTAEHVLDADHYEGARLQAALMFAAASLESR